MIYFFKNKIIKIFNAIVITTMALLFLTGCDRTNLANKKLILYNNYSGEKIIEYDMHRGDTFSIEFIHSVNMSPVIDYYKFDKDNDIVLYKTKYYNYGAGVETTLKNNETISYGKDGSMIIENINEKIYPLIFYLSSIYDHILRINDKEAISLWEVCGKNTTVRFEIR